MIQRVPDKNNGRRAGFIRPVRDRKQTVGTTMRTISTQGGFRAMSGADFGMRGDKGGQPMMS